MKKVDAPGGRACNLGIWDTAGQERFDSLSSFYCRGARAAIICYDLTDRTSFEALATKWIRKVSEEAEPGCHVCLVGTKLDLIETGQSTRAVTAAEAQALADKHQAHTFETSAKVGGGVPSIFCTIVAHFQSRSGAGTDESRGGLRVGGAPDKPSGCC